MVAGELNLPTAGWQGNVQVEIFDLTGRRWVSETVQLSGVERIRTDVQELPSGHYVVRMAQGGQSKAANLWCASDGLSTDRHQRKGTSSRSLFHSAMGEKLGVAIVDADRGHVFDPISTIEVAGLVSFQGQV